MSRHTKLFDKVVNSFMQLPGVGIKTAQRYAYFIIEINNDDVNKFSQNLIELKKTVKYCEKCGNWTDSKICSICQERDERIICVVKDPKDIIAFERVKDFNGVYHVLHGVISPINDKGPDEIRLKELLSRITDHTKEVIVATNPDVEGEATAMYISKILKPFNVKVSRIAQGVSMGSDLEYADEVTLSRALERRTDLD